MEYKAKLSEKYTPVLHCISSFEGTSYEKLQDYSYHFLCLSLFYISFEINRYHFSQFIRTSFQIIWKN